MTVTSELKAELGPILRHAGFSGRGPVWRLDGPDVMAVIELQKSNFDSQHYLNIGFWVKKLGKSDSPRAHQCHANFRAEGLFPERRYEILQSLSGEDYDRGNQEERSRIFTEIAEFVRDSATLDALKSLYANGRLRDGLVFKEARELFAS